MNLKGFVKGSQEIESMSQTTYFRLNGTIVLMFGT
jgi:hypothetical protein